MSLVFVVKHIEGRQSVSAEGSAGAGLEEEGLLTVFE
jgi:hypothetical protein